MSIFDMPQKFWEDMSAEDRQSLLEGLRQSLSDYQESWWGGKSPEELSQEDDFDSLPGDLSGRLLLAFTNNGFSVAESERGQRIL